MGLQERLDGSKIWMPIGTLPQLRWLYRYQEVEILYHPNSQEFREAVQREDGSIYEEAEVGKILWIIPKEFSKEQKRKKSSSEYCIPVEELRLNSRVKFLIGLEAPEYRYTEKSKKFYKEMQGGYYEIVDLRDEVDIEAPSDILKKYKDNPRLIKEILEGEIEPEEEEERQRLLLSLGTKEGIEMWGRASEWIIYSPIVNSPPLSIYLEPFLKKSGRNKKPMLRLFAKWAYLANTKYKGNSYGFSVYKEKLYIDLSAEGIKLWNQMVAWL